MARSDDSLKRRKLKKKKKTMKRRKAAMSMLADEKRSTKSLTSELKNVKAELKLMKYQPQKSSRSNAGMTSYTKKYFAT